MSDQSNGSFLTGSIRFGSNLLCLGLSIFAIVVAAIGVFDMVVVSGVTVLAGLLICFFRMEEEKSKKSPNLVRLTLHVLMTFALMCIFFEWGYVMFEQEEFFITISKRQNAFGWVAIAIFVIWERPCWLSYWRRQSICYCLIPWVGQA